MFYRLKHTVRRRIVADRGIIDTITGKKSGGTTDGYREGKEFF